MDWFDSLIDWIKEGFQSLVDLLLELPLLVLDGILQAIASLVASIPTPGFLSTGLSSLVNGLPDSVLYLASQTSLASAFAIIAGGVAFRLTRKLFTLGQW
jgi:hypothetical protein